jgi:hypothetical protein
MNYFSCAPGVVGWIGGCCSSRVESKVGYSTPSHAQEMQCFVPFTSQGGIYQVFCIEIRTSKSSSPTTTGMRGDMTRNSIRCARLFE